MPVRLNPRKSLKTQSGEDLNGAMRSSLYDVANQLRRPSTAGTFSNRLPTGQKAGDQTTQVAQDGTFSLSVFDANGNPITARLPNDINSNTPFKEGAAAPALTDYPNDGDNGWYYNTTAGTLYYVRNRQGTLIYLNFVAISGTITAAQHGDLSAAVATMHAFTQITGSITAAQHGNFTAIAANDDLHALATAARPGFLSAAFFTRLNAATDAATASTLVLRDASGDATFATVNATLVAGTTADMSSQYRVAGTKVVGARNAGWTTQTAGASKADLGAAPTVGQLASWARAIQDMLAGHGLIGQA
jgi:hypothetical protein